MCFTRACNGSELKPIGLLISAANNSTLTDTGLMGNATTEYILPKIELEEYQSDVQYGALILLGICLAFIGLGFLGIIVEYTSLGNVKLSHEETNFSNIDISMIHEGKT